MSQEEACPSEESSRVEVLSWPDGPEVHPINTQTEQGCPFSFSTFSSCSASELTVCSASSDRSGSGVCILLGVATRWSAADEVRRSASWLAQRPACRPSGVLDPRWHRDPPPLIVVDSAPAANAVNRESRPSLYNYIFIETDSDSSVFIIATNTSQPTTATSRQRTPTTRSTRAD